MSKVAQHGPNPTELLLWRLWDQVNELSDTRGETFARQVVEAALATIDQHARGGATISDPNNQRKDSPMPSQWDTIIHHAINLTDGSLAPAVPERPAPKTAEERAADIAATTAIIERRKVEAVQRERERLEKAFERQRKIHELGFEESVRQGLMTREELADIRRQTRELYRGKR